MSIRFLGRKPAIRLLYTAGIILLIAAAAVGWYRSSMKPEHVFWGMVGQSLSTSAVTVQASQENGASNVKQTIQYAFGGQSLTHSLSTLTQGNTTVVNEMIGTPSQDYTRYQSIQTDQKRPDGKPLDFSKVIGVWAKKDAGTPGAEAAEGQLFSQAALGTTLPLGGVAVPIANLSPSDRSTLITQIKNDSLYKIDYGKVTKETKDGRRLYVYDVTVNPVAYAAMMKAFAKDIGLHTFDSLNPGDFKEQAEFSIRLTVDAHARRLVSAEAVEANLKQTYTSYDVATIVAPPADTIPVSELQKRLADLQK